MIYTIEPKAIVDEYHGRGARVAKKRGGTVYLTEEDAKDALRTSRGVVRMMAAGIDGMLELDAKVYQVRACESDTIGQGGHGGLRLKAAAWIVEWKDVGEVEG